MQDLRLAIRALVATPVVTAVAVLSLALGIGANAAIFSLVNSLILRTLPLPVPEPQRLVILSGRRNSGARPAFSSATFDQIRRHGQAFDGALAYSNPDVRDDVRPHTVRYRDTTFVNHPSSTSAC